MMPLDSIVRPQVSNKGKVRRERKAEAKSARQADIRAQKREQRRRIRESLPRLTRKEKLLMILDLIWRATGGPIVAITQWSPFSPNNRKDRSEPSA